MKQGWVSVIRIIRQLIKLIHDSVHVPLLPVASVTESKCSSSREDLFAKSTPSELKDVTEIEANLEVDLESV